MRSSTPCLYRWLATPCWNTSPGSWQSLSQNLDDPFGGCDPVNKASLTHHAQIVDALAAGNGSAAEAAMHQLLTDPTEADPGLPAQRKP
jgi:DNA-binding FadR family transcriptional regulator